MDAVILINQGGGSAGGDARERVEAALAEAGIGGEIELIDDQIEKRAKAAADSGAPLLIAGGGDGTISAVAGAIAGSRTALGILPMGTLNHLARDLAIPFDLAEAAAVIAAGHRRKIDVAELNGRIFVNNSAIGLYPLMLVDRDSQQKRLGRSKRLAMLVASLRTLARFHDHRLTLRADGGSEGVDTPLLFVGNNDYRLAFPAAGRREALDDGHLCVLVMRKKGVAGMIAATLRALVGLAREDDMVRLDSVRHLRVESRRTHLTVSVDGETCSMTPPLDYRIRPGALTVIASAA
ncbi:MAG: diacylglycerol kinase family lipid kinase [Sphingomonas sp.]|uniref:diacylglycerol/lipid kinase family protein n=1 Tax=Sphingomonas sp. TaxID=28214 RepID=UPI00182E1274|nr:diacylglycerol kinase family protein [Sphingomonas sp.]MBA3666753.1 diacylglycerol kinase family lipid kinase [Sphingomonas sp.]